MNTKSKVNLRALFLGEKSPCHITTGPRRGHSVVLIRKGEKMTPRKLNALAAHGVENCRFHENGQDCVNIRNVFVNVSRGDA